jgi:hypothetical protein
MELTEAPSMHFHPHPGIFTVDVSKKFCMVQTFQNIHWDTGSILRPCSPLITLDEKPEFAWKPQISRTVIAEWLDLQHGKHLRLFGSISDAASLRSLIWNWRWLRCRRFARNCIMNGSIFSKMFDPIFLSQ